MNIHLKLFLKSLSWRFTGSIFTFILAYVITGKLDLSMMFTASDFIIKIVLFYLHERVWLKLEGK